MAAENNKNFLQKKEKDITKNKAYIVKAAVETLNLNILYKKKKQRKKQQKNIKDIMMMKMMI